MSIEKNLRHLSTVIEFAITGAMVKVGNADYGNNEASVAVLSAVAREVREWINELDLQDAAQVIANEITSGITSNE